MKARKRRSHRAQHHSLAELNITPLLDLVFVLLVIFIITTPQLTNSLEINLPSGKQKPRPPAATPPKIHRIQINDQGRVSVDHRDLAWPEVRTLLQEMKRGDSDLKVVVEASDEADYQHVVSVFDLLQQLEIKNVGLATGPATAATSTTP